MKYLRYVLIFVVLTIIVVAGSFFDKSSGDIKNFDGLKVVFYNVGQGDSELIAAQNNTQMLIDGGPKGDIIIEKLSKEMPPWDRKIEFIVLTHPHADHLNGLVEVLKRYDVGQIISTDAVHTTPQFFEWLNLIKNKKIPFKLSKDVSSIELGNGAVVTILYPKTSFKDKEIKDLNDASIIMRLEYKGVSFLFTGDAGEKVQEKLLLSGYSVTHSDFLKVPHHGSKTGLSRDFLEKVSPTISIIEVGKNSYGHPSATTLKMLKNIGAKVYRTDKDGDVRVMVGADGKWEVK